MAPFFKTAAAFCLVGLFGLQSVAANVTKYKYEVTHAGDDAYLTVKLARNGKISAKISAAEKDTETVTALEKKVKADGESPQATCDELLTADLKKFFHHTFTYTDKPDYRALVQEALNAGLAEFTQTYPADADKWTTMWTKEKAVSVMHLLGASSTKVGCVIAKCAKTSVVDTLTESDAETVKAVLFCKLSPAAKENEAAFSEEYFKEIIARKDKLNSMTEDDLKDPIQQLQQQQQQQQQEQQQQQQYHLYQTQPAETAAAAAETATAAAAAETATAATATPAATPPTTPAPAATVTAATAAATPPPPPPATPPPPPPPPATAAAAAPPPPPATAAAAAATAAAAAPPPPPAP
ncbi:uncharacterized protein EMH_0010900 [Eimeria mitis]|uniref:SAG family member n=1 Tax=Eimeria mitis TaxID=44415 RepID=U6K2S1_9EIME|nr:uncharacterized protein EMH_0010900 [Eimeria mitis]CDJ31964.1 hypothetical protein EMH_0010900 [Eimeria mitis]